MRWAARQDCPARLSRAIPSQRANQHPPGSRLLALTRVRGGSHAMRSPLSSPPPPPAAAGAMSPDGSCRGRQLLGYLRVVVACQHAAHAAPGGQCHMVAQQRLPVSQSLPSRAVAVRRPFRVPLARRCSRTTWRASSWNWSPRQRASRTASCPLLLLDTMQMQKQPLVRRGS